MTQRVRLPRKFDLQDTNHRLRHPSKGNSLNSSAEKVLILGEGVSAFLSVVRSIGRQGVAVHVAWCSPDSPTLASRYVERFHPVPFADADGNWLPEFLSLLETEKFDLVLPTNEQSIRALFPYREQLAQHARLCLMDEKSFDVLFDKVKCCELAGSLGVRVPRSAVAKDLASLRAVAAEWGYPLVLKPVSSYDPTHPTQRRNVRKAYGEAELDKLAPALFEEGAIQVQENFIGRGVGVELLVDRGQILLAFQHERVHQPLRGGASSYRKSVSLNDELLSASRDFVAALEYSGVVMLEYLYNDSGEWRFVEANARFWGSLPLAIAAGADFPFALYRYWVHGDRRFNQEYRTDIYCREIVGDGLWLLANFRADKSDRTLATLPIRSVLGEVRHVLSGRERYDTFTLDDPKPAFAQVAKYALRSLRRARLRLSEKLASLPRRRRAESEAARRTLQSARKVIFLCWGNICRSPFAEVYARQVWPAEVEVHSRGLHYKRGRTSPRNAIDAARQLDVSLDEHRSTILTADEVLSADAIICFDELIRTELLKAHPAARGKAFRFGALSRDGVLSVTDPLNMDAAGFQKTYVTIKRVLDETTVEFAAYRPLPTPIQSQS